MVPVRHVHHDLVGRLGPRQPRHHVLRVDGPQLVPDLQASRHAERNRLERAVRRLLLRRLEVEAGPLEEHLGRRALHPPLEGRAAQVVVGGDEVERLRVGRAADHLPGIPGGAGLVDDERSGRPELGRDLVLVGPPAVVGHGRPAEGVLERRVVDQEEQDLAADVGLPEVVPVVLGCARAVADEDELRVRDADRVDDVLRRRHVVGARLQGPGLTAPGDDESVTRQRRDADERDVLHPGAVGVARLEPQGGELLRQIGDGEGLPLRPRRPPAELVRRQPLDPGQQRLRADPGRDLGGAGNRIFRRAPATDTREHPTHGNQPAHGRPPDPRHVRVCSPRLGDGHSRPRPTCQSRKLTVSTVSSIRCDTGCPPECPASV